MWLWQRSQLDGWLEALAIQQQVNLLGQVGRGLQAQVAAAAQCEASVEVLLRQLAGAASAALQERREKSGTDTRGRTGTGEKDG